MVRNILEKSLEKVNKWLKERGLEISPEKTVLMVFSRKRKREVIRVKIEGKNIEESEETKFLGININNKLNWNSHISAIKTKAKQCNNIIKAVAGWKWGAHPSSVLQIYKGLVRATIDWGLIFYQDTSESNLVKIKRVQYAALRSATGNLITTPLNVLLHLAAEPDLKSRARYLSRKFLIRTSSKSQNQLDPAFRLMRAAYNRLLSKNQEKKGARFLPTLFELWEKEADTIGSINKYDKPAMAMVSYHSRFITTDIDTETGREAIKSQNVKEKWKELIDQAYPEYTQIYTDGSKTKNGVAAAAICPEKKLAVSGSMDKRITIMAAEIQAIKMAIRMAVRAEIKKVVICTDSLSTLEALGGPGSPKDDKGIMEIRQSLGESKDMGVNITMIWTPAHKGIEGNDEVDKMAKQVANDNNPQNKIEGLEAEHCYGIFKEHLHKETFEDMTKYPKGKELCGPVTGPHIFTSSDLSPT
ncbi:uncharacterized protein LOC130677013 [Microplitis mediator]|uniref:uncharacterized protein LOC130677013 n=1 Tax=Microplitis mediator TaxID=375433 RepID=UPI0025540EFF|nr:uncharacterized protein LOC130677013 [Microplitis mediator]